MAKEPTAGCEPAPVCISSLQYTPGCGRARTSQKQLLMGEPGLRTELVSLLGGAWAPRTSADDRGGPDPGVGKASCCCRLAESPQCPLLTKRDMPLAGQEEVFTGRSGTPLKCSCLENPRDGGAW